MKKFLRCVRNLIAVFMLIGFCGAAILTWQGYQMYRDALEERPLAERVSEIREKTDYTELDKMPQFYLDAVVATEDHRFFEHNGVDVVAICRALWNDVTTLSLSEGGSTITQQLAKNLCFTQEKKLTRKLAEIFLSFQLEQEYNKEEILELYLNSIYFGSGCYTVSEASHIYFGKEPAEMTEYESTLLAGIPNAPSIYDPTVSPELSEQRRRQVTALMVKNGKISQEKAKSIVAPAP